MKTDLQIFPNDVSNIICRYLDPNPRWVKYWKDDNIKEIKEIIDGRLYDYEPLEFYPDFSYDFHNHYENHNIINCVMYDVFYILYHTFPSPNYRNYRRGFYKHEANNCFIVMLLATNKNPEYDYYDTLHYKKYDKHKLELLEELYKMRSYAIKNGYKSTIL